MLKPIAALCLLCLATHHASAQQATVTHNVNLRPTPSTDSASKELLRPPAVLTLLDAAPTSGYYHVQAPDGTTGWVYGHNVSISSGASTTPASPPPPAASAPPAAPPPPPATPATYAIDKAACPPVGMHASNGKMVANAADSDDGMRDEAKRHIPTGTTPVTLTLTSFAALQADADAAFGDARHHKKVFTGNRDALRNLAAGGGTTVSEGQLVQLAAYVNAVRAEGKESVNCSNKNADDSKTQDGGDFHINVGPKGSSEWHGIVAEMIPQLPRPAGWDTATIGKIRDAQLQVLVVGGLTYDNEHLVNDNSAAPNGTQPKRIALFEIHPITAFYICATGTCDPTKPSQWTALTAWAKAHP